MKCNTSMPESFPYTGCNDQFRPNIIRAELFSYDGLLFAIAYDYKDRPRPHLVVTFNKPYQLRLVTSPPHAQRLLSYYQTLKSQQHG